MYFLRKEHKVSAVRVARIANHVGPWNKLPSWIEEGFELSTLDFDFDDREQRRTVVVSQDGYRKRCHPDSWLVYDPKTRFICEYTPKEMKENFIKKPKKRPK